MKFRKTIAALASAVLAVSLAACGGGDSDDGGTLVVGFQDNGFPTLVEKSGVLKGAPYKVEWALLTGPAANLSALYSKKIDIGHMGDTSLTIEQANARQEWTAGNAPLKIVAGWRPGLDTDYPQIVTAVRTDAGINSLKDLRGRKWAYNFGGYNHAHYLASLIKAGLTEKDIKPVQFADGNTSAAGFNSGQTEVYSGLPGPILESLDSGKAKILLTEKDTGVPGLHVWTARADVLADPVKDRNLRDFFTRLAGYWDWHQANLPTVKQTLKDVLKLSDRRAEFEAGTRAARYRLLDEELIKREQKVADVLFAGNAIKRKVDVTLSYDPRYNTAQKAQPLYE